MRKSRKGNATKLDRAGGKLQHRKRNQTRPDLDDDQVSSPMKQRRLNLQSRIDTTGVRSLQNEDSDSDEETVIKKDVPTGQDKMKHKTLIENESSETDANSDSDSGASDNGTSVKMSEKGFTGSGKGEKDNVESDDDSGNEDSDEDDSGGGNDGINYDTDDDGIDDGSEDNNSDDDSKDDDSDDDSSDENNDDKDSNGDSFKLPTGSRDVKLKAKPLLKSKQSLEKLNKQPGVVWKQNNSKSLSSEDESSDNDSESEREDLHDEDSADELKDKDKEIEIGDDSSASKAKFHEKVNTDNNEKKQKPIVKEDNESSDSNDSSDTSSEGGDDEDGKINDLEETETAEHEEEDEFVAVKRELANIPLEDLMKIKEKLGLKMFNRIMHGDKFEDKGQKVYKRANKNRPMETSSKKRVPVLRHEVVAKEKIQRDPRFDDLSGEFEDKHFQQNYSFLDDVKSKEKLLVKKQLAKTKNEKKKKELTKLLSRMEQQEQAEKQKKRRLELEQEWKERERNLVEKGKAPYFLKKSDKKKLELAEKFKELQKSGKVEKYMNKKLKKNARKEKKKLPNRHEKFM